MQQGRRTLREHALRVGAQLWVLWAGAVPHALSSGLVVGALTLFFLDAAGTVELVYTVTPSYAALVVACVVGAPFVVRGWRVIPTGIALAAAALLAIYVLSAAALPEAAIPTVARASSYREVVYIGDLILGLGVLGLVTGLWSEGRPVWALAAALAASCLAAAVYGLYQWPAQRYGWPLADINNAINTTGVTRGAEGSQGTGLLGWERIRGTFPEPHHLGAFLASVLPVAVGLGLSLGLRRSLIGAATSVVLAAMLLTASVPAWAALSVGSVTGALVVAIEHRVTNLAAGLSALLALGLITTTVALIYPAPLAGATGRTAAELERTTEFRLKDWEAALDAWAVRPVLGHGPGQSSVQLARAPAPHLRADPLDDTVVLGSAHGLWAAALVDVGLVGLAAWTCFLGALLAFSAKYVAGGRSPLLLGLFAGTVAALAAYQVTGARLETWLWALIGTLLAAVCSETGRKPGRGHEQPGRGAD